MRSCERTRVACVGVFSSYTHSWWLLRGPLVFVIILYSPGKIGRVGFSALRGFLFFSLLRFYFFLSSFRFLTSSLKHCRAFGMSRRRQTWRFRALLLLYSLSLYGYRHTNNNTVSLSLKRKTTSAR